MLSDRQLDVLIRVLVDQALAVELSTKRDVRRYLEVSLAQEWPTEGPPPSAQVIL